jgi:hypothetical protein
MLLRNPKPVFEKDDVVALLGIGPIGTIRKVTRQFVVTERGVYHKGALLLMKKGKCTCGKKH